MISQNHHSSGDNVGRDKVINLSIKINPTLRLILIILVIVPLTSFLIHLAFNNYKQALNKNDSLTFEEIDYRLKQIGERSTKYEHKEQIMSELLDNFNDETIVSIEGFQGTKHEIKELPSFLEELSLGGHDNLSIKSIQNNIISISYVKKRSL